MCPFSSCGLKQRHAVFWPCLVYWQAVTSVMPCQHPKRPFFSVWGNSSFQLIIFTSVPCCHSSLPQGVMKQDWGGLLFKYITCKPHSHRLCTCMWCLTFKFTTSCQTHELLCTTSVNRHWALIDTWCRFRGKQKQEFAESFFCSPLELRWQYLNTVASRL